MTSADEPISGTVEYTLGRIDGKLDALVAQISANHRQTTGRLDEQDTRISKLENGRSWLLGAGATVAAGVSAVGAFIFR